MTVLRPSIVPLLVILLLAPCAAWAEAALGPAAPPSAAVLDQALKLIEQRKAPEAWLLVRPVLQREPQNAEALWLGGRLTWAVDKDLGAAIALLERAVEVAPSSAKVHLALGNLLGAQARQAGMLKGISLAGRIKAEYERAVELDPRLLPARFALLGYLLLAPGVVGGSVNRARVQAIEIGRLDAAAGASAQATIAEHEGELEKAAAHLERAAGLAKDARARSESWNRAGYVRLRQERPDDALACFAKAVAEAPEDANVRDSLGDGHAAKQEWPQAITAWRKALELDPGLAASWFSLAQALEKTGDAAGAQGAYQRFLALQPNGPRAEAARKRLQASKG